MKKIEIPIWQKLNLTLEEASAYSNIGLTTLRQYVKEHPNEIFIEYIGNKLLIKRKEFEEWNSKQYIIK